MVIGCCPGRRWRRSAPSAWPSEPDADRARRGRDPAGLAGHPDLHLGHDGSAEGRDAAAEQLGVPGRAAWRPSGVVAPRRRAVPVAAAGALVRQGAALGGATRSGSSATSTAGCRRSWRTCRWSGPRSWPGCRGSSRRSTRAPTPRPRPAAGPRPRSSTGRSRPSTEIKAKQRAGRSAGPDGPGPPGPGRQAGLLQDPGPDRRPDAGDDLRLRGAQRRRGPLVRRRRPADHRGLRPDREQRGGLRGASRRPGVRLGRAARCPAPR